MLDISAAIRAQDHPLVVGILAIVATINLTSAVEIRGLSDEEHYLRVMFLRSYDEPSRASMPWH